jgi:hypothetical protein
MVGDNNNNKKQQHGKDRGILKPSWAFFKTTKENQIMFLPTK